MNYGWKFVQELRTPNEWHSIHGHIYYKLNEIYFEPDIKLCERGFHVSPRIYMAQRYAKFNYLFLFCRVWNTDPYLDEILSDKDKSVWQNIQPLAVYDLRDQPKNNLYTDAHKEHILHTTPPRLQKRVEKYL